MTIPQTFDEAFERAKQLVSIFSENEGKYLSPGYSEAQARLEFIVYELYDLIPDEIAIVEGSAK